MRHHYTPSEAAIKSIKAGAHLIMLSEEHYENEVTPYKQIQRQTIAGVVEAVKAGELPEAVINERLKHVLYFKYQKLDSQKSAERLTKSECESIAKNAANSAISIIKNQQQLIPLKDKHFMLGCCANPKGYNKLVNSRGIGPNYPYSASSVFITQLEQHNASFDLLSFDQLTNILNQNQSLSADAPLVLLTEDYPLPGEDFDHVAQTELIKKAHQLFGTNLIVLALRSDYHLAQLAQLNTYVCAYSSRETSAKALANLLLNK